MAIQIRIRRDTAANWTSANPVLGLGEPGLETDTRKLKYGDGTTAWTSLPYGSDSGFDGQYSSLTGKPTLFDGAYSSLTGSPSLATVATTGAYSDLSGKPTLFDGAYSSLTGAPSLATVATSGSYSDLSGTPTVPTNLDSLTDVTITTPASGQVLKYNGTAWINDTDSTGTSGISLTSLSVSSTTASGGGSLSYDNTTGAFTFAPASIPSLATVATSGDYNDLTNKPTLFDGAYASLSGKPTLFDGAYSSLSGAPTLAIVATSGSYDDLTNKPSIPSISGLLSWAEAPATNTSAGTPGQIAYDAGGNLYVCVANETWAKFSGTLSW